jgi:hypothetical protein
MEFKYCISCNSEADKLKRENARLIEETHNWSNAVRKLEAEQREKNDENTRLKHELGELYATIFGDGGHRQAELDALPNWTPNDDVFGAIGPRRYTEAGLVLHYLLQNMPEQAATLARRRAAKLLQDSPR